MATHNMPDFDTLSVSLKVDKKDLKQKYQKRVDNWTSFFDKWSSLDDSEDKELELEKDGDWNLRVGKIPRGRGVPRGRGAPRGAPQH